MLTMSFLKLGSTFTGTLNADGSFQVSWQGRDTVRGVFATEGGRTVIRDGTDQAGSLHRHLRGHQTVNDNPGSLKPSRFRCSVLRARDLFDENMDGVADHLDAAVQATADALRTASEA